MPNEAHSSTGLSVLASGSVGKVGVGAVRGTLFFSTLNPSKADAPALAESCCQVGTSLVAAALVSKQACLCLWPGLTLGMCLRLVLSRHGLQRKVCSDTLCMLFGAQLHQLLRRRALHQRLPRRKVLA